MKKLNLTLIFSFLSLICFSQQIKFDKRTHDFGKIEEKNGDVTCYFVFENLGDKPIIITNVETSCGCTTPEYPKTPILPKKKGKISATFSPKNRPGKFHKAITIYSNAGIPQIVYLKGEVLRDIKDRKLLFPKNIGELSVDQKNIAFGRMHNYEKKTQIVKIANFTKNEIELDFSNLPEHIIIESGSPFLAPKEEDKLKITYDASKRKDWDFVVDKIALKVNGKNYDNAFFLMVNILEDFSKLSEEEKNLAPNIKFDNLLFNFGEIEEGKTVEQIFTFTNTGKKDLIIRKVNPMCNCLSTEILNSTVAAGKKGHIKVRFNSTDFNKRKISKNVVIISNSPHKARSILWIKGKIK